jgi:4-hydroxy-tetrahydrodipicolinate synthase
MTVKKFIGTGVAIATPFRNDGTIDFKSYSKLLEYVITNGVNYVVTLGTTGESVTLNKEEKTALVSFTIDTIDKRVPLVVGIGGNNTREALNCIENLDFEGIDAILSVCPYYNKPTQEGIIEHFKAIAAASPVPVILYNIPGRTGINMTAETTLKLAQHKNIIAIKEASGNFAQIMKIIKYKPKNFGVISGDDAIALPLISVGAIGVISVIANVLPSEFSSLINFALEGKFTKANEINLKLLDLYEYLFIEGNPAGIKAALNIIGIIQNNLRLPLVPVSSKTYQKIKELLEQIKNS